MALHSKWSSGDLIFYDGTQDIFTIKNSTGGILVGADDYGIDFTFYGATTGAYVKWDESEDELDINATVEMQTTEKIQFYDTNNYINASTTGQLDIVTDGTIYLNGEVTYPTPETVSSTGDNQTLTVASNRSQFLTSTSAFNLIVPASSGAGVAGIVFNLFNSTGAACTVYEETTGTLIVALGAGEATMIASNATEWRHITGTT